MFNDTKLASLIKRDTDVMGLKENNIYYLIIDRCFCIKIARLSQYPKFMAKLFSMDKLLPDGELLKGNYENAKQFFNPDSSDFAHTATYTNIDIKVKEIVGIWNVHSATAYASGAYAKRYTDAVDFPNGRSNAGKNKSLLYFVDNTDSIEAVICPYSLDVAQYIEKALPSVCYEIAKNV